jgi:hypothetical protein
MGKTDGVKLEIGKLSEGSPRFLEAKGITISTFTSIMEPLELSEYFKSLNRNFMVFDMDQSSSAYNLTNEKLHEALFGHMGEDNDTELEEMTNRLIDEVKASSNNFTGPKTSSGSTKNEPKTFDLRDLRLKQVEKLNKTEKQELVNEILDKGIDNISSIDREILEILSKEN